MELVRDRVQSWSFLLPVTNWFLPPEIVSCGLSKAIPVTGHGGLLDVKDLTLSRQSALKWR
jgi:hypothetical protein